MAKLRNLNTNKKIHIHQYHLIGRHKETVQTYIGGPDVSRVHARIRWTDKVWTIQDSSRNGTFVNGRQILNDEKKPLQEGDKITFGKQCPDIWQLVDASPPACMLIPISQGLKEIELRAMHALPSEDEPEVTLYMSSGGQWLCESDSGVIVLKSGDCVGITGKVWRFIDAAVCSANTTLIQYEAKHEPVLTKYTFRVSQNEEHICLRFHHGENVVDLGFRQHHYTALVLARQRCEDREAGIVDGEQGWIDRERLSQMLEVKEALINIHIFRLRKEIVNSLPGSYTIPMVVERRNGEIRFGSKCVEILRGNTMKSMRM